MLKLYQRNWFCEEQLEGNVLHVFLLSPGAQEDVPGSGGRDQGNVES